MISFSEIESLMVLCFYKFDKITNVDLFVKRFNEYFAKEIGEQTITYQLAIIRSSEEAANMPPTEERVFYRNLWKKYTDRGNIRELRDLYRDFKNGKYIEINEDDSFLEHETIHFVEDAPVPLSAIQVLNETEINRRKKRIAEYALTYAGHICECDCNTPLFLRKDNKTAYTEAHHLVPLKFQKNFNNSLDVAANVVSLCPACHRKLHYGANTEEMLDKIYQARRERLRKCGIIISYYELLLMYK